LDTTPYSRRTGNHPNSARHWLYVRESTLAGAIFYTLDRWQALTRAIAMTARIEIDNDVAEHALRAVVLKSKSYLFVGSSAGGKHAAGIYARPS